MAHILEDRVRETTTTTSTGAITPLGAVANYRTFSSQLANGDTTLYAIVHRTANEWEVGVGTWNTGNTISRTTILDGSNGTSAVNLSAGVKDIFMTLTPSGQWPRINLAINTATGVYWNNGEMGIARFSANALEVQTAVFVLSGGTTTRAPLLFTTGGSLMSTPSAGSMEMDATNLYATTDQGNRGYVPIRHLIRADSVRTYTSNTSAQTIFNSPANGRITLETGCYRFSSVLSWGAMSATLGNRSVNMLGAGTATVAAWMWIANGMDGTSPSPTGTSHLVTNTSAASIVTATVGTALIVHLEGSFEVTVAGTLIPSTTMVTAAASTLSIGSFLEVWRIGSTSVVSVGQWD